MSKKFRFFGNFPSHRSSVDAIPQQELCTLLRAGLNNNAPLTWHILRGIEMNLPNRQELDGRLKFVKSPCGKIFNDKGGNGRSFII